MGKNKTFFVFLFLSISIFTLIGSEKYPDTSFDAEAIIKTVCEKIDSFYPHKEIASRVINGLKVNLSSGKYKRIDSPALFASMITSDMETLSQDKHLDLLYDPEMVLEMKAEKEKGNDNTYTAAQVETNRMNNFGFKSLKILDGNIGYLDLQVFFDARYAGDTAVAAMNFFSNCDALVIDLRNNGGGWGSMVSLLLSYFINHGEPVVMNIMRSTIDNTYDASMNLPYVPGKKLDTLLIYILTSGSTASAAEAFAFQMKQLNQQTTIVGETTAGAEHPVDHQSLDCNFILQIPCYQVVYSRSKNGWEGTGIKPDIPVKSSNALDTACLDALKKLKIRTENPKKLEAYQWALDGIQARLAPLTVSKASLKPLTGKYGDVTVWMERATLFYQYKTRDRRKLIPIGADYFLVEGTDYYRIRFIKQPGQSMIMKVIFNDGYTITRVKTR